MLDLQNPTELDIRARANQYISHSFDISEIEEPTDAKMTVYKTNYAGEVLLLAVEGQDITIENGNAIVYVQEPDYHGYRGGAVWKLDVTNALGTKTVYEGSFTIL